MPAGTIALTNNSATVTGTGTSFTTELKVNDFLVSTVGGLAYTLGVKSIESNTSLTLMDNFTGPSASGQSWTPVPYGTMAAITAQVAAQVTYAIRGFNLDKANWQQVFTGTGTVTVKLPDGTSWQGPAWGGIAGAISGKANTEDVLTKADNLKSLTDAPTARTNLGFVDGKLPLSLGGTGGKTLTEAQSSLGIKADAYTPADNTAGWITPTGANGWSVGSTVVRTGYRKVMGKVQLSLNMTANGAKADGTTMFTLPAGYVPTTIISVSSAVSDLTTANRAEIQPDGRVVCQGYNGSQRNLRLYIEYPVEI